MPGTDDFSKFFADLPLQAKVRYREKVQCIGNVDPYTLQTEDDHNLLPKIEIPDILCYLLFAPSPAMKEELKNYRSLESYNQFVCGWVKKCGVHRVGNLAVLLGQVYHSQRLRTAPAVPWVIAEMSGHIISAHCDCMAGLGESCCHVGAILFYAEYAVRSRELKTVTEKKAYWKIPSKKSGVEFQEIKDIDFSAPKTLLKRANGNSRSQIGSLLPSPIPEATPQETMSLFSKLHNSGIKSSILYVVSPFSDSFRKPVCRDSDLFPPDLRELYDSNNEDILEFQVSDLRVTQDQLQRVEELTRKQSETSIWHKYRAGRITASNLKLVCKGNPDKPALSLIKKICYPQESNFTSIFTTYGKTNEKEAKLEYATAMTTRHTNHVVRDCGLFISKTHPFVAATPDAVVDCACCGRGCLEVKCPYLGKVHSMSEIAERQNTCLTKDNNGAIVLSRQHSYYYQIQAQMFCTTTKYCDVYVWGQNDSFMERVYFDEGFMQECLIKAETYFARCVLPELAGKVHTKNNSSTSDRFQVEILFE